MAIFGTDINNLGDLFKEQVKDMHSSESQVESNYSKWVDKVQSAELKSIFQQRIQKAKERQQAISKIADAHGFSATGHKCKGTEGLLKEGNDFLGDAASKSAVLDAGIIANAQRVEHYAIAGYGCAHTYAQVLGHTDVANTLERFADEAGDIDEQMTALAERTLNEQAATA